MLGTEMANNHLCTALVTGKYHYLGLHMCHEVTDIDNVIGLDSASMAITYLGGKATLFRRLWMHCLAESVPMRTVVF